MRINERVCDICGARLWKRDFQYWIKPKVKFGYPEIGMIYGEIRRDDTGALRTTGAQRTGCSMCGFGIQLEKRPHRFDRLFERNPKEWEFWMIEMGWGAVLDYIGVGWRPEHQITMEELLE